jgi:hypothetical protein
LFVFGKGEELGNLGEKSPGEQRFVEFVVAKNV